MAAGLAAQESGHAFSLGTSVGLLSGQAEEIVYLNENSDAKLSQLLWDVKPLVYAGVDIHYDFQFPGEGKRWGLFTDSYFKIGIPGETGEMEDRDWISTSPDWLTHYSVHDNRTDSAILLDINTGFSFRISENYLFKAFLSYSFMYFSWAASGGSILYPSWYGIHEYLDPGMDVITYEQNWNAAGLGVSLGGAFNRYFAADISFKISPLVWCNDRDTHILRNIVFTEIMSRGFLIEPGLVFSYTPVDFFSLSLSVSYRNITGTRGNTKVNENGEITVYRNAGGAGYSVFDTGIYARFNLLKLIKSISSRV